MDQSVSSIYGEVGPLSRSQSQWSPQSLNNRYQLALKYFMGKKFDKSFELIKPMYSVLFDKFANGGLPELLFIKILNLYLLEIGLFIDPTKSQYQLSSKDLELAILELSEDKLLIKLEQVYVPGFKGDADYTLSGYLPTEVLFNIFLTTHVNRQIIFESDPRYSKLLRCLEESIYNLLDKYHQDQFAQKLVDLYVYEALPLVGEFQRAKLFIKLNDVFSSQEDSSVLRLEKIESEIESQKLKEQQESRMKAAKRIQEEKLEKERQLEQKKQQDLKYRTLNDIKKAAMDNNTNNTSNDRNGDSKKPKSSAVQFQQRVVYLSNILAKHARENVQIILILLIASLFGIRYLRARKINLREQLVQTIKMAFKVTYL